MDVVVPLANMSKRQEDWEIRYSLRSLSQQPWVDDVYIVGYCPEFLPGVNHIPCDDPFKMAKDANMIRKVLTALEHGVSQQFLITSDDQYIMRPIDPSLLGPYLEDEVKRDALLDKTGGSSRWSRRVQRTVSFAEKHGKPGYVFEAHMPYVADRDLYREVFDSIPWQQGIGFTTHVYLNWTVTEEPQPKPQGLIRRVTGSLRRLGDTSFTFLNHNNPGLCPLLKQHVESVFPEPSRWEA
jgi:hypothetical protein